MELPAPHTYCLPGSCWWLSCSIRTFASREKVSLTPLPGGPWGHLGQLLLPDLPLLLSLSCVWWEPYPLCSFWGTQIMFQVHKSWRSARSHPGWFFHPSETTNFGLASNELDWPEKDTEHPCTVWNSSFHWFQYFLSLLGASLVPLLPLKKLGSSVLTERASSEEGCYNGKRSQEKTLPDFWVSKA